MVAEKSNGTVGTKDLAGRSGHISAPRGEKTSTFTNSMEYEGASTFTNSMGNLWCAFIGILLTTQRNCLVMMLEDVAVVIRPRDRPGPSLASPQALLQPEVRQGRAVRRERVRQRSQKP